MEIEEALFVGLLILLFVLGLGSAFEVPSELYGAALGASLTVLGAYWLSEKQNRARRQNEARALARQQKAARSVIAMDLADLTDYCERSLLVLLDIYHQTNQGQMIQTSDEAHAALVRRIEGKIASFDKELLGRIQKLIELESNENGKHLTAFLHWMQVSSSRAQGHIKDYCEPTSGSRMRGFTSNNALFPIAAIAQLHIRIAVLFPYARGEIDEIGQSYVFDTHGKFGNSAIANSLNNLNLGDELDHEDYEKLLSDIKKVDVFTGR